MGGNRSISISIFPYKNILGNARDPLSMMASLTWPDLPRHTIRTTLSIIRSGRAPWLDVSRCLLVVSPSRFLHILWFELNMSIGVGMDMDGLRRLAVFVLATPHGPGCPPLLPIFLHSVFPAIMDTIDQQQGSSQALSAELLVAVLSSAIMIALHLERATLMVSGEQHYFLGEPSTAMARRLANELRYRKQSPTAKAVAQRLASSATFVTHFPVFKTEL